MTTPIPSSVKVQIVNWFLAGEDVNHIVYLLRYQYGIGDISEVLRSRLRDLVEKEA